MQVSEHLCLELVELGLDRRQDGFNPSVRFLGVMCSRWRSECGMVSNCRLRVTSAASQC